MFLITNGYKGPVVIAPRDPYKVYGVLSVEEARALHIFAVENELNSLPVKLPSGKVVQTTGLLKDRFLNLCINDNCVTCSRELAYFRLEKSGNNVAHLNGYSQDHFMMTRDHIVPRAKGGKDHISNYQLMCAPCNSRKGSKDMQVFLAQPRTVSNLQKKGNVHGSQSK